jgi:ubiquinone/menaquinone biosynthesis C-methylase UbiE
MPQTASTTTAAAPGETWARHYATGAGFRWWPCEELVRAVGGREFGTVVEVGCGNGANLWFLAERARQVIGIDGEAGAVEAAEQYMARRGVKNVSVGLGDATQLAFADGSVDAVVDVMVSQHLLLREHDAVYREYRRVLRPGGWLFLYHLAEGTTVAGKGLLVDAFTRSQIDLFPEAGRVCTPPAWVLMEQLGAAGFKVGRPGAMTRFYPSGAMANYAVIEGEAR